jgi:hypothetical protein
MRFILKTIAVLSLCYACFIGSSAVKNRHVLDGMREQVQGIQEFERIHGRLPTNGPGGGPNVHKGGRSSLYYLFTRPGQFSDERFRGKWPAHGGWVLGLWRGEWFEYYTSWNDHYTVADAVSVWGILDFWLALAAFAVTATIPFRQRMRPTEPKLAPGS